MMEIGRVVVKTAGRDAGKKGAIIDIIDKNYVIIDGQVRRKKCNVTHLEPLDRVVNISRNSPNEEVKAALAKLGVKIAEKAGKKEKTAKPQKAKKK